MKIKIANFNISGGIYDNTQNCDYLDKKAAQNYDDKFQKEIIKLINKNQIDVISFQEIITTKSTKYINKIMENTNLKYCSFFELSPCNLVENTNCGIAVLSRYKLSGVKKIMFNNPKLAKTTKTGKTYYTFDKGCLFCIVNAGDKKLRLLTHHGFPYRRFNSTSGQNLQVFKQFDDIIEQCKPDMVTGDFNEQDFMSLMPKFDSKFRRTINAITTDDGMKFDDICILKSQKAKTKIVESQSDHFMVMASIEI